MTLWEAKVGDWLEITALSDDDVALEALRYGIDEGSRIKLTAKLPGGPVVIAKNQLEIALGRQWLLSSYVYLGSERFLL